MLLEIWCPKIWVPDEDKAKYPDDKNVLIFIPEYCVTCNSHVLLYNIDESGANKFPSAFTLLCSHLDSWSKIWNARIKGEHSVSSVVIDKDTFGTCTHCGEINPYQSGPFLCYQCTADPWR